MLDGAGAWSRFRNITLPLMTPVILYDIILGLSLGLQVFTQAYIITQGGPADASRFYVLYLYDNAFRYGKMGYASAHGVVLFVITFVLAMLIFRWSRRWVHYEGRKAREGTHGQGATDGRVPAAMPMVAAPSIAAGAAGLAFQAAAGSRSSPGSC